jgi:hypothetical protein
LRNGRVQDEAAPSWFSQSAIRNPQSEIELGTVNDDY